MATEWLLAHIDLLAEFSLQGEGDDPAKVDVHCKLRCACVMNAEAHKLVVQNPDRFDRQAADWARTYAERADGPDTDIAPRQRHTRHWDGIMDMIADDDGDWDHIVSWQAAGVVCIARSTR